MKENTEITKKYDPEAVRKTTLSMIGFPNDKDSLIKEIAENIIPKLRNATDDESVQISNDFRNKSLMLMRIYESEKHPALMESFEERYRIFSHEMTLNVIKEYDCITEVEKAVAELMVNAYVRVLDNSRRLNNELECTNITPNRNVYIANLSKQLDRAHRQFTSALMTLKQIKAPQIEMNIKAHTAFISNNQQVNIEKDEIINTQ